jgi:hypothetical protein
VRGCGSGIAVVESFSSAMVSFCGGDVDSGVGLSVVSESADADEGVSVSLALARMCVSTSAEKETCRLLRREAFGFGAVLGGSLGMSRYSDGSLMRHAQGGVG